MERERQKEFINTEYEKFMHELNIVRKISISNQQARIAARTVQKEMEEEKRRKDEERVRRVEDYKKALEAKAKEEKLQASLKEKEKAAAAEKIRAKKKISKAAKEEAAYQKMMELMSKPAQPKKSILTKKQHIETGYESNKVESKKSLMDIMKEEEIKKREASKENEADKFCETKEVQMCKVIPKVETMGKVAPRKWGKLMSWGHSGTESSLDEIMAKESASKETENKERIKAKEEMIKFEHEIKIKTLEEDESKKREEEVRKVYANEQLIKEQEVKLRVSLAFTGDAIPRIPHSVLDVFPR